MHLTVFKSQNWLSLKVKKVNKSLIDNNAKTSQTMTKEPVKIQIDRL